MAETLVFKTGTAPCHIEFISYSNSLAPQKDTYTCSSGKIKANGHEPVTLVLAISGLTIALCPRWTLL